MSGRLVRRVLPLVGQIMLCGALAVASTYPIVRLSATHLPQGSEPSATVPLLNLWTIWWNVDRLSHGYRHYWNAPIYHPEPGMLAGSEPHLVLGWLAWPLWHLSRCPARVYNELLLLGLTLNGVFGFLLSRQFRLTPIAACSGGAMICVLPLVHWQLGVLQLTALWGILWTLLALVRYQRAPGFLAAVHLAVALATTYLLCSYYGLFLGLLLLVTAPLLLGRRLRHGKTWGWAAVGVATVVTLLWPVLVAQRSFLGRHSFTYSKRWIEQLSAAPGDYGRVPGRQLVAVPVREPAGNHYPWPLSPGTLKLGMAAIGLAWGIMTLRRRRIALTLAAIAVTALLLSMGPRLRWGPLSPYEVLVAWCPGFSYARNLFRFAFFVQLAVVLLAAVAVHHLQLNLRRRPFFRHRKWLQTSVMLFVAALLVGEAWPGSPQMYRLPPNASTRQWVGWLRDSGDQDTCLACFPLPPNRSAVASQPTAEWMYYQIWHTRPMINGYSTFVPASIAQLYAEIESFPDAPSIAALRAAGVTHAVVDSCDPLGASAREFVVRGCRLVLRDADAGVEIWQLPPPDEDRRQRPMTR